MKFFKGKEATRVKKIRGVRAKYINPDHNEVNIDFVNEAGEQLTLQLTPDQARGLIGDMSAAYEAINPPLRRPGTNYSDWMGME